MLTSDPPSDKVWEGLCSSNLKHSSQVQTIVALYNQEILRGGGKGDYHRLRMCVKLHVEQAQRSKNLWIQSEIKQCVAVTEGKGQKSLLSVEGKWVLLNRRLL